jgi:hypothetical protein
MRFVTMLLTIAPLLASSLGCSRKETLEVSGHVTFDDAPVEKGEVSFIATDGSGATAGGVIENGAFRFETKPGSKRVEIRASRPLPANRQPNPEMGLAYEDYIPAQFNRDSKLTAEVSADGERTYQFDLKSKP